MHILLLSNGKVLKTPFGGEDIFTRHLGKWLAKNHHDVTLMGIEFGGLKVRYLTYTKFEDESSASVETGKKKVKFGHSYLLYSLRAVFWIFQVLRILSINLTHKINIIHCQDSGYTGLAAVVAGKILSVPVVLTLHGIRTKQIASYTHINEILRKIVIKFERKIDVYTLRHADIITIVNATLKYYVEELSPNSIISTIPGAIKIRDFEFSEEKREPLRKTFGIDKKAKVVGYVGRLTYEKNLFTLLNSFAEAVKKDSSLKLMLVGEGPLELELRKKTSALLLDNKVIFCGFRDDVNKLLSTFDIFVLPSFIESTSIALLEAMACGLAIICSDISANCELVTNKKNALLVDPNDPQEFTDAIRLLSSDETLRNKLGINAKIIASQYDEDIIFPIIIKHYDSLSRKN